MSKIKQIESYEILSSGGKPSLEVKVTLEDGSLGVASVPYGASAGSREAHVLFDDDENRYGGKGMLKAVKNINTEIKDELIGMDANGQQEIDHKMIDLDGTENKQRFGANAILGVSLAVANAASNSNKIELYEHIRNVFDVKLDHYNLPKPMMVVIEGGKHADNSTDLQEYMFAVQGDKSASESVRAGLECYHSLKKILKEAGLSTNVGNEGAFAPDGIGNNEKPFELMIKAVEQAGYRVGEDIGFALDAAASEFYADGMYNLQIEDKKLTSQEMIDYVKNWLEKYPIVSMEDMLNEDDWEHWPILQQICTEHNCLHVGDDLTVTNPKYLQQAIDSKSINTILIKLNQIGSLSETVETCKLAMENGLQTIPSHRGGGETNDTSMVDLAVAMNSAYIKVGPTRGERLAKYNRLMEIERGLQA